MRSVTVDATLRGLLDDVDFYVFVLQRCLAVQAHAVAAVPAPLLTAAQG
jgi:hypothetical protein